MMDPVAPSSAGGTRRPARIKVAVLVGSLDVGGAELDIVRNFPRLDRGEFDVVVVSFGTRGVLGPELERQGIRVIARLSDSSQRESRVWRYVRVTSWVARTFRELRPEIGHFFLPHAYVYGMLACMLDRLPTRTVMSRLSLNFYRDRQPALAWIERALLHRRVDIAIGNSQVILDELVAEGIDRGKVRLLHNGIEPSAFERRDGDRERARDALGVSAGAFVTAAVGNLHAYKGHGDLIEACARIRDALPQGWQLLVAGRDEEGNRARYEARVAELGLGEHVRFLGSVQDVRQLLFAADVFVQPSHHEGLPNAVVEAMATSLPVVGTRVGGIPEAVSSAIAGERDTDATGWLVEPGDIDALASTLLEASRDPDRLAHMGARARERVLADFSLERSVATYETIYRELVP